MAFSPAVARAIIRALGDQQTKTRAATLSYADAGHGYDAFGMHPDYVAAGDAMFDWIYKSYFRVSTYDAHHIPTSGPAIVACNHSGTLPIDGMMVGLSIYRNTNPPRNPRAVADYFVSSLPFIGTFFARAGVVGGSRGNVRRLLESGNLLLLFPEGTPGIGKPFSQRYQLQDWRQGHCELAIRYSAPVVPVAVVGAEEQMPQLTRIPLHWTGLKAPYLPIPATPIPLPVHYHIYYGEPLRFDREFRPQDADDPEIVLAAAQRVKAAVQALIHRGLAERKGIFQ
jgi:1-acyl-sn-glycerol-3-phosphate acyltransferase